MKQFCLTVVAWIIRGMLSLRYRLKVEGFKTLGKSKKGILFLPNHSAEIDPVILMSLFEKDFRPRPVVVEHFYALKGVQFLMKACGALSMPNIDNAVSQWKVKEIDKLFEEVAEGLKKGENFLIYPSGKLKTGPLELIGGASFVHRVIQESPEAKIVLIRTTGLWGSRFSRALIGKTPNFGKVLLEGFKILLKNGIFFTPRRKVLVEISPAPTDFPKNAARLQLNRYLEDWYNRYPKPGGEPLSLVSSCFWKEDLPEASYAKELKKEKIKEPISKEIKEAVVKELAKLSALPEEKMQGKMQLTQDLGLDSLDLIQIYLFLDRQFDIVDLEVGELVFVEDVFEAAAGFRTKPKERPKEMFAWPKEARSLPLAPLGASLQEAFLLSCERMDKSTACADRLSGAITYRQLKRFALVLSLEMRKLPGEYVGVLLPAAVGTYVTILALLLAKKIPVVLNWTAGTRSLNHAKELASLQAVISARAFLNKMQNGDLGTIEESFYFLEEIKEKLSWRQKIRGAILSLRGTSKILRKLRLDKMKGDETAVLLFTSGTEGFPKAVPLSHHNLLSNQRSAFSCIGITSQDILYCVLPPFHSFGFSVTGLFPLLTGLKCCYAPDPTDSHGMAHDLFYFKPTIFCCAPSFIKALFQAAHPSALKSLRLFISGAEKAPKELFEYIKRLGKAELIEGYGITECSPIVTCSPPGEQPIGVGLPIPGVNLIIIDHVTLKPLPANAEGEICIEGPNVFSGYLRSSASPFITLEGKRYYRSGDRGYLDETGHLILSGRLKRFVKIGGEMVSLAAIEEELVQSFKEKGKGIEGPLFAISAKEREGDKPFLILFTPLEISREEVNETLKASGFGKIMKIGEVRHLGQIPLTGIGKTNYPLLDAML